MPKPLTPRQADVLAAIEESIRDRGYPPTLRELGDALGIASTNGVNDHLSALENKGWIRIDRGKARGIRVLEKSPRRAAADVLDEALVLAAEVD